MNNKISFDQYQRYKTTEILVSRVKEYCNKNVLKIIEVGANKHKNLEQFLCNDDIKYLDIDLDEIMLDDPKYILGDATNLKNIKDNMFDFVIALDVFEHITKSKRRDFLKELNRISIYGVLLSAPFDYEYVIQAEHRVNEYFKAINNSDFIWLKEHNEEGLPNICETLNTLENMNLNSFKFEHGELELWEKLIKCSITSNNIYVNELNLFYNNYIYSSDVGERNYRTFIFYSDDGILVDFIKKDIYTNQKNQVNYTKLTDMINEFNMLQVNKFILNTNIQKTYSSKLYFDDGNGFAEKNTKYIENEFDKKIVLISKIPENTVNIRFDPTENIGCLLQNLEIFLDDNEVKEYSHNGINVQDKIIFETNDPQIFIENTLDCQEIKIICDMELVDKSVVDIYYKHSTLFTENTTLQNEIFELTRTDFTSKLYCDTGSGYSEDNFVLIENIDTNIEIELVLPENTKNVRFDPVDGRECIVKNIEIHLDYDYVDNYTYNGFNVFGGILFNTTDPQINIENLINRKKIYINCKIVFVDKNFLNIYNKNVNILNLDIQLLNQNIENLNNEVLEKNQNIENLNNEVVEKNQNIENLNNEVVEKNQNIENLNIEVLEKNQSIEFLDAEILQKDKEIGLSKVDFQILEAEINRINNIILDNENKLVDLNAKFVYTTEEYNLLAQQNHELNAQLVNTTDEYHLLAQQNRELNQELVNVLLSYQDITNAFFWKITKPFRAILDMLKRIKFVNLLIKGVKSLKNDGFSVTLKKVNSKLKKN